MLAARALFALKIGECEGDAPREPSELALLGGVMESEDRAVLLNLRDIIAQFIQAWGNAQKARAKRPRMR
jgi:hypothetical protein